MKSFEEYRQEFMERAILLARKGWGNTSPNPMVGAVLVKNGKIIGEGYHKYAGADHAEVMAIKSAKGKVQGSTLYVNLEPCCHYGRTPPCTSAIIESGIKKVVIGICDPDPRVSGKGLAKLRKSGIIVMTDILEEESQRLNEGYWYYKRTGLPFVIMKIAQTLDGKIATANGNSKWISGRESREYVQEIRAGVDAILVGSGTVLVDNPELVVHGKKRYHRYPARIILDSTAQVPSSAKVFKKGKVSPKTYWVIGENALGRRPSVKAEELGETPSSQIEASIEIMPIDAINGHINVKSLLQELGKRGIQSILVEGGARVHGAFLDAKMVNKVLCFIAPKLMGGRNSLSSIAGKGIKTLEQMSKLKDMTVRFLGEDIVIEGYL